MRSEIEFQHKFPRINRSAAAEYTEFIDLRHSAQEMFDRVLDEKSRQRTIDDTAIFLNNFESLGGITAEQMRAMNLKMLGQFVFLPNEGQLLPTTIGTRDNRTRLNDPKFLEFLRQARKLPNADLQERIDDMLAPNRQRRKAPPQSPKRPAQSPPARPLAPAPAGNVRLVRLSLKSDGSVDDETLRPLVGWLPAGQGIDVAWNDRGIYVMKEPGVFSLLDNRVPSKSTGAGIPAVFDGRYVWFVRDSTTVNRHELLAIDPRTETSVLIDADDGLPNCNELRIAPLSPGKVIVVGSFGQAFAATVELTPQARPSGARVKVVHEFRSVPAIGDNDQWRDGDLIFEPANLQVIRGSSADGSQRPLALVWRVSRQTVLMLHPILIDPESGDVRVLQEEVRNRVAVANDLARRRLL